MNLPSWLVLLLFYALMLPGMLGQRNHNHTKGDWIVNVIPGKFYVIDVFHPKPPTSGPFDSAEEAESDRLELNIDGDCVVCQAIVSDSVIRMKPIPTAGVQA